MTEKSKKDFSKGKIYCIRNTQTDDTYIGSTVQPLSKRMDKHRRTIDSIQSLNAKVYQRMRELGKDCFYIELLEDHPCENVEQLRKREGELIRQHRPSLNMRIECRTDEEKNDYQEKYKETHKERKKETDKAYSEKNQDKIRERKQTYYQENKEREKERVSKYKNENADKIKAYKDKYNKEHSEERREYDKKRYEEQKEQIKEQNKVKYECECGSHYTLNHKSRHIKTQKHQNFINNQ